MEKLIPFSLRGCGYGDYLVLKRAVAELRILVIPVDAHESSSQIVLDCQISPDLIEKIRQLDRDVPIKDGVMIEFAADFRVFGVSFSIVESSTPQDLVVLKGVLREIIAWRQDSNGINPLH